MQVPQVTKQTLLLTHTPGTIHFTPDTIYQSILYHIIRPLWTLINTSAVIEYPHQTRETSIGVSTVATWVHAVAAGAVGAVGAWGAGRDALIG